MSRVSMLPNPSKIPSLWHDITYVANMRFLQEFALELITGNSRRTPLLLRFHSLSPSVSSCCQKALFKVA
eukprot:1153660-Pelagomonas_calceolata.AAC.1